MSRKRFQIQNPGKFGISMDPDVANILRRHCAMNNLMLGPLMEGLVVEYLKKEGYELPIVVNEEAEVVIPT